MSKLAGGILKHKDVTEKIYPKIEKGKISKVNSVIIHQTSSSNAEQTFNAYDKGGHDAHF